MHPPNALRPLLILAITLTMAGTTFAQITEVWTQTASTPDIYDDAPRDIAVDANGNVYVTGSGRIVHGSAPANDYMTIKFLPNGAVDWVRYYNGIVDTLVSTASDDAWAIDVSASGRVAVTGTSYYGPPYNNYDVVTILYDTNGDTLWTRRFMSPSGSYDAGRDVVVDDANGVYVLAQSSSDGSTVDFLTIHYDSDGDTLWTRYFSGTHASGQDYPTALVVDPLGRCYVTGKGVNTGQAVDISTILYDTDGSILWQHDFDSDQGGADDESYGIALSSTGDVYTAGRAGVFSGAAKRAQSPDLTSIDAVVIKYDGAGDTAWVRYYNGPDNQSDDFSDIAVSEDGSLIAAAGSTTDASFELDLLTCVYDENGDTAWVRTWSGVGPHEFAKSVTFGRNNEVWVTGWAWHDAGVFASDVVVLRYSSTGELLGTWLYDGSAADRDEGVAITYRPEGNGDVYVTGLVNTSTNLDFLAAELFGPGPALVVSTLADDGPGSLRQAIIDANLTPGRDSIVFAVAGTIAVSSTLPLISDYAGGTVIDGLTAPGATIGAPSVVIDGSGAGVGDGFTISSDQNIIKGLEIRGFSGDGVHVINPGRQNRLSANLIHSNSGLAIDLGADGVTPNDPTDADTGANDLLNYPVINGVYLVAPDSFNITGTCGVGSTVELYVAGRYLGVDTIPDPSGHGEAWEYLGSVTDIGVGTFNFPAVAIDHWATVAVTATDPSGNTSEFSLNRKLIPDSLIITTYSPVHLVVIEPDFSDSVGPTFNTIGPDASYDSTTDYGIGPNGLPGEFDDRVVITNVQEGTYQIKVYTDPGGSGNYFLGIRVDGTNEYWGDVGIGQVSSAPVANPVPPPGVPDNFGVDPDPPDRGDFDGDGFLTALDLNSQIDMLFFSAPLPVPPALADLNCDGFPDALDLNYMIDHLFFAGPPPCY